MGLIYLKGFGWFGRRNRDLPGLEISSVSEGEGADEVWTVSCLETEDELLGRG